MTAHLQARRARRLSHHLLLAALLATTAACNALVGFSDLERVEAAASNDAASNDAAPNPGEDASAIVADATAPPLVEASARCDPTKPFGPAELVAAFDGAEATYRAVITPDELEAFWLRQATPTGTPRHAKRASITAPWVVETVSLSPAPIGLVSIAVGGLKLYYQSSQGLTAVTRSDRSAPFGNPKTVGEDRPASTSTFGIVFIVDSDDVAYYDRTNPSESERHLFRGRHLGSAIVDGVRQTELDLPKNDDFWPALNAAQTAIYWMSSTGGSVRGARYVSHRASRLAPWGKPVRVPELEDLLNADIAFVSDDDCVVYITRGTHTSMATRGR